MREEVLYKGYFKIEKGKGIRVFVTPEAVILKVVERAKPKWRTIQEISLPRNVLAELFIRLPYFFQLMKGRQFGDSHERK